MNACQPCQFPAGLDFYTREDYRATTEAEFAHEGPLPASYTFQTEHKAWIVFKAVISWITSILSWIIFPIGLGRKILDISLMPSISYPGSLSREIRMNQIALDTHLVYKRFSIEVDGVLVDSILVGRPSTLLNKRWVLFSNGNCGISEAVLRNDVSEQIGGHLYPFLFDTQSNALLFNYPGVGESRGFTNRETMKKAYLAMLHFLEDKNNGIGAEQIICYGISMGGGVQEALNEHHPKEGVTYVVVREKTFSELALTAYHVIFTGLKNIAYGLVKLSGWNFSTMATSFLEHEGVSEIVIQTASVCQYLDHSHRNAICHDHTIHPEASLAYALLESETQPPNRVVIGTCSSHNDSLERKAHAFLCESVLKMLPPLEGHEDTSLVLEPDVAILRDRVLSNIVDYVKKLNIPRSRFLRAIIVGLLVSGALNRVQALINLGFACTIETLGADILHILATHEKLEAIHFMIQRGYPADRKNEQGRTPLHIAAEKGCINNLLPLLYRPEVVNEPDLDGRTPLHLAAISGNQETVQKLLELGANPLLLDGKRKTVLHLASLYGHTLLVILFLQTRVRELIDAQDAEGETALHHAVSITPKLEIIELLLKADANRNIQNCHGYAPLHWAVRAGHVKCTQLLLSSGADPHILNENHQTPIDMAELFGQAALQQLFLNSGVALPAVAASSVAQAHYVVHVAEESITSLLHLERLAGITEIGQSDTRIHLCNVAFERIARLILVASYRKLGTEKWSNKQVVVVSPNFSTGQLAMSIYMRIQRDSSNVYASGRENPIEIKFFNPGDETRNLLGMSIESVFPSEDIEQKPPYITVDLNQHPTFITQDLSGHLPLSVFSS